MSQTPHIRWNHNPQSSGHRLQLVSRMTHWWHHRHDQAPHPGTGRVPVTDTCGSDDVCIDPASRDAANTLHVQADTSPRGRRAS